MHSHTNFPFPTQIEIIRTIAVFLDIKHSVKELDELAYTKVVDPRKVSQLAERSVKKPLAECTGEQSALLVHGSVCHLLDKYTSMIGELNADGVERKNILPLLLNTFFTEHLVTLLQELHQALNGPSPSTLFSPDNNAIDTVITWASNHEANWSLFWKCLSKEHRDRLSSWRKINGELPSSQFIQRLPELSVPSGKLDITWERLQIWLLVARGIEAIRRNSELDSFIENIRLGLWGAKHSVDIAEWLEQERTKLFCSTEPLLTDVAQVQHLLKLTTKKAPEAKDSLRQSIDRIKTGLSSFPLGYTTQYWIDWHDARWHLLSGNLVSANELYKQAFNDCLYRSGVNQKLIIQEARLVASALPKPDKVFLKRLKFASLTFGYDIPSVTNKKASNKFEDSIEDWEVDLWKGHFYKSLPQHCFFPECRIATEPPRVGPLLVSDSEPVKPDLKHPNKKIKVGDTWQKKFPQLVWFSKIENYDATSQLLASGATVNCHSDSGDTPILMAIQALNVTTLPYASLDDRFWKLISQSAHHENTVNMRTQKTRLLPIICAVETGQPEVVETLLSLGADPNMRGETDEQTALNVCLKYIGYIKEPKKFLQHYQGLEITPAILDSIRRHSAGAFGHTLEQQEIALLERAQNPRYQMFRIKLLNIFIQRITTLMKLEDMREIARLLIESGADVNAEHRSPLPGYTPLMLAAELDERSLFEFMRIKGGDPKKTYANPADRTDIDCWKIAHSFQSREIQRLLEGIEPYIN